MGKRTSHGLPGLYNSTEVTLADGQGSALAVDPQRRLIVSPYESAPASIVTANTSNTDGASTALFAAAGAGLKTYITDITITNMSVTTVYVEIKDNATAKWTFPVPANGGVTHAFETPLAGTANTAWNFDSSAAVTTLYISAAGYTGA
jgi:hypothetical protein